MEYIDFLIANPNDEAFQDYLLEETGLWKIYSINIDGRVFRRHIPKIDEKTGLPKYLANQRVKFGSSPVKNAYISLSEGNEHE